MGFFDQYVAPIAAPIVETAGDVIGPVTGQIGKFMDEPLGKPKGGRPKKKPGDISGAQYVEDWGASQQARLDLANQMKTEEQKFRNKLLQSSQASEEAINNQLNALIEKTGYNANLRGAAIGANQANAGMLRSGQAAQNLATNKLQEVQQKAALGTSAAEAKYGIRSEMNQQLQGIADKRAQINMKLMEMETAGLNNLSFKQATDQLKMDFGLYIDNLNMSAQNKQDLYAMIGAGGTLAGLGLGYYAGGTQAKTGGVGTVAPYSNPYATYGGSQVVPGNNQSYQA